LLFAQEPLVEDSKETGVGEEVQSGIFFMLEMVLKRKLDSVTAVGGEKRN